MIFKMKTPRSSSLKRRALYAGMLSVFEVNPSRVFHHWYTKNSATSDTAKLRADVRKVGRDMEIAIAKTCEPED